MSLKAEANKNAKRDLAILEKDREIASLKARLATNEARYKTAMVELDSANATLEAMHAIQSEPTMRAWERLQSKHSRGATAIIALCDWHTEERVDPSLCAGLNHFNLEIAEQRVRRAFQKTLYLLDFARHVARIEELVIWLGGDLITGFIHEELVETNYLHPSEASLFVQDMVASGLNLLCREAKVRRILVPTSYGNHGRTTAKPRIKTGYANSWEWLMYMQLARELRHEKRIAFKIEKGYHNVVEVQGRKVRMHHGDAIKYQGGIGGITIPTVKKIAAWQQSCRVDLDIFGHYHQFLDHGNFIACPCLIGYSDYALRIGASYEPPAQMFAVIDKLYGKVMSLPIFVHPPTQAGRAA